MSLQTARRADEGAGQIAMLDGEALRWRDREALAFPPPAAKRPCVLVPSEKVLLVVIDLPLSSHRQRMEAAPFAVEGMLAEALPKVHVALGPLVSPKRYLAAVVSHATMREWSERLAKAGLSQARLVPDVLTLPVPEADGWTVLLEGARAQVRRSEGSGFAIGLPALATAWRAAGCPPIVNHGDALPAQFLAQPAGDAAEQADRAAAEFDLHQGIYADASLGAPGFVRRAAWVLGVGAAMLGAIQLADTLTLSRLAEEKRAAAREILARAVPDLGPDEDLGAAVARLMPNGGDAAQGRFLPLLTRVSEALTPQAEGLTVQSMSFDAAAGELSFEVAAPDLAALQRIEAAMIGAGLQASSGVATAEGGAAEVRIVVRDDGLDRPS